MSLWLSHEELVELTGYKIRRLQREALARLGVPFQSRPADGFPLVRRADHEQPSQVRPKRTLGPSASPSGCRDAR